MASTITSAPLTVKITESCTLNGYNHGGTFTKTISGINEISKRIVTATTAVTTVLEFDAADIGPGKYLLADMKYLRITNLGSVDVTVQLIDVTDTETSAHILSAGGSFMLFDVDDAYGAHDSSVAALAADGDISSITLDAASSTADVEIFIASS